jgi:hypothetical protein
MKWTRRLWIAGLALALSAGVSCTTNDTALTEAPAVQQSDPSFGLISDLGGVVNGAGSVLGGVVGDVLSVTDLLTCSQQKYAVTQQVVGPKGGTIKVGSHSLNIPKGALTKNVTIKAEQMSGSTNSIRFSPEGLRFAQPAQLTMSYENCLLVVLPKHIVYTSEKFKILEVLRTLDLFQKKSASAPIDHFSRYAVAW